MYKYEIYNKIYSVTRRNRSDTFTNTLNNASTFVAQDAREEALRIQTIKGVSIRVAHSCGDNLDPNLPSPRRGNLNSLQAQRLFWRPCDCSAALNRLKKKQRLIS